MPVELVGLKPRNNESLARNRASIAISQRLDVSLFHLGTSGTWAIGCNLGRSQGKSPVAPKQADG
jgi:hypothetical protein